MKVLIYTTRVLFNLHALGYVYHNLRPETIASVGYNRVYLTDFEKCKRLSRSRREARLQVKKDITDLIYLASLVMKPIEYNTMMDKIATVCGTRTHLNTNHLYVGLSQALLSQPL